MVVYLLETWNWSVHIRWMILYGWYLMVLPTMGTHLSCFPSFLGGISTILLRIICVYIIYIKRSCFTVVGSKGSIRWCRLSEPSVRVFFGVEKLGLNKYNYWSVNLGRKRDSPETMARYLSIQQKQQGWCWNFSETTHLNHEKITTQLYIGSIS